MLIGGVFYTYSRCRNNPHQYVLALAIRHELGLLTLVGLQFGLRQHAGIGLPATQDGAVESAIALKIAWVLHFLRAALCQDTVRRTAVHFCSKPWPRSQSSHCFGQLAVPGVLAARPNPCLPVR